MTWVPYWDDSFSPVPISRLREMYAAGFRVWARYVAGGSSGKWFTRAEIDAWFALGPDTGIFVLFEAAPDEPTAHPELGDDHARAARAAARALGVPDDVAICPAMDTNVNTAQWQGAIADYCRRWKAADTTPPLLYVEADAGGWLYSHGLTAGTFVPAAYGWNDPPVLYTPANAPGHVIATQEHNGRQMAGGVVDIGHIRTAAPIWWRTTQLGDVGVAVPALDQTDKDWLTGAFTDKLFAAIWGRKLGWPGAPDESLGGMLADLKSAQAGTAAALAGVVAAEKAEAAALAAFTPKAFADAVVAALPQGGATTYTPDEIASAVVTALGHTQITVTVAPPAAGSGS